MAMSTDPTQDLVLKEIDLISRITERLSNHGQSTKQIAVTSWIAATGFALKFGIHNLHLVALVGAIVFWHLDSFFLAKERRLRDRHVQLAAALAKDPGNPPIKDPMALSAGVNRGFYGFLQACWCHVCSIFAFNIWPIYGTLVAGSLICWVIRPIVPPSL